MNPKEARKGIWVKGAREHNLKSLNVFFPRNKITVVTGLSGSGKSSLVFDTLYAEGQRRYIQSLSSYARYFMEKLKSPNVDSIFGLSPVIAIDQKTINTNPRSTVGTVTEIYDYLRLLFSKLGRPYCPIHHQAMEESSVESIVRALFKIKTNHKAFQIFSPIVQGQKGEFKSEIQNCLSMGYTRFQINGKDQSLKDIPRLSKRKSHHINVLIDQLYLEKKYLTRLKQSLKIAFDLADGFVKIKFQKKNSKSLKEMTFSTKLSCPQCLYSCSEIEPKLFSFNNSKGACSNCNGLGFLNPDFEDPNDSQDSFFKNPSFYTTEDIRDLKVCSICHGKRLNSMALSIFISNKNIHDLSCMDIKELKNFLKKLRFSKKELLVAQKIQEKIQNGLSVLENVGLSYLSLHRTTQSLSGGEAQRIFLASRLSSVIIGILYILDEPSIGLHPVDYDALLNLIQKIKERKNTVVMVEHDEHTIRRADYIVDIGPGAGQNGGNLMFQGSLKGLIKKNQSLTGQYLSKKKNIPIPKKRRTAQDFIFLEGASGRNLKNVNLKIPLSTLIGVTGVSGSGKSTLIIDTLYQALMNKLYRSHPILLPFKKITGVHHIDKVIVVDQKPIGKTSRSIPATYVGIMSLIRNFMSQIPSARVKNYRPGHFSFNVDLGDGRCSYCKGAGVIKQEMHFLSATTTVCEVCQGKRYSENVLSVTYKGKNLSDILNMTVKQALDFFENHPQISNHLKTLKDVGLSYLTLGQSSTTLSGGEAQRIKLTKELSKKETRKTVYILDEPTRGLHFDDIKKLLKVMNLLVDRGNTVIVIEHNMDIVKCCDYLVDLGIGGGRSGGKIIACGSPEKVSQSKKSATSPYIQQALQSI